VVVTGFVCRWSARRYAPGEGRLAEVSFSVKS
jgi:hypothetical protein